MIWDMSKRKTALPSDLLDAYKATNFEVHNTRPFVLKIGEYSPDLKEMFNEKSVECGCFITAYNPFSEERSVGENLTAQSKLKEKLAERGNEILDGLGADPSGEWKGEPSFFVLGLSIEQSKILGKEFNQNAVVWCDLGCTPELILLR